MHEAQVREQQVGHVLIEERCGADKVKGYSVWSIVWQKRGSHQHGICGA